MIFSMNENFPMNEMELYFFSEKGQIKKATQSSLERKIGRASILLTHIYL